jgi:hypothetical protein
MPPLGRNTKRTMSLAASTCERSPCNGLLCLKPNITKCPGKRVCRHAGGGGAIQPKLCSVGCDGQHAERRCSPCRNTQLNFYANSGRSGSDKLGIMVVCNGQHTCRSGHDTTGQLMRGSLVPQCRDAVVANFNWNRWVLFVCLSVTRDIFWDVNEI